MDFRRRQFFKTALGGMLTTLSGCAAHDRSLSQCPAALSDFELSEALGPLPVYRCKSGSGPAVVLLHELPGMSPEDIALAKCLAQEGLSVYVPLLFGEPGQNRFFAGYFQSCAQADFECSALSTSSPIIGKLRDVCRRVSEHARGPVGVIGMCLTGAFPLALLGGGVQAAVLCQPTLPFNALFMRPIGAQSRVLGLASPDIDRAVKSRIAVLAMRYRNDALCPAERFRTLRETFRERLAQIEIEAENGEHSTLAGDLNLDAFADAVNYLKVRLGAANRPQKMKLAKLDGRPCEIGVDGRWRRS
jgi:dienelactone hydrolase